MSDEIDDKSKDKPQEAADWPSVDDVKPTEEGGPSARTGFNYQDEVAVSILLDMLEDPAILKTHCETHDDILVVRQSSDTGLRSAEYVQVKAIAADKLCSVADLCQRKNGKSGTSILEKSLERDAHKEISRFRIVTLRPVVSDLTVLTLSIGSVGREPGCKKLAALKTNLDGRFTGLLSPKGNDCGYWLENCYWDVRHDEVSIRNDNELRVAKISTQQKRTLLPEPAVVLLDELRAWVKDAGAAKWDPDRDKKIISRDKLLAWWNSKLSEFIDAAGPSGGKLVRKMEAASLPKDVIDHALDLRRRYAEQLRTPRYSEPDECEELLDRVNAETQSLRSRYVAGQIDLDSKAFHSLCLDKVNAINNERPEGTVDRSAFLIGCLYDIADRCLLRFERPSQ